MNEVVVFEKDRELFIKSLRTETAQSHQQLEDNPVSKALLDPHVTLADYQTYLSKLYSIVAACEKQVFPMLGSALNDLENRRKSDLIIRDLLETGFTEGQIAALPEFHFEFAGVPEAMGVMYVLEGSTLGGKIIYKHIHEKLGLTPEQGAAYFWGYGSQTGVMWKSFIAALTQFAAQSDENQDMIEAAKKTFTAINTWLSDRNY